MHTADKQRPAPGTLVLDHVSHFVPDLEAPAVLLRELGFAVTERSDQKTPEGPVGAANRCLMLEQGYVEMLAPTLDTPVAARLRAAMAGGSGVERAGVHLACFGTLDPEGEHRRLAAHGFDPQPLVDLRREALGEDPAEKKPVRFRVVRPAPEHMPEGRIQYVEQVTPEAIWTERALAHDNGVYGLASVYVVADDPVQVAARWARFSALLPQPQGSFVVLHTARGRVFIGKREDIAQVLGSAPAAPALAGYALACTDPATFAARCGESGLPVKQTAAGYAVTLPASLGGSWLVTRA